MRANRPMSSYSGGIRRGSAVSCCAPDWVWGTPPDEAEDAFSPFPSDFLDVIHAHLQPLKGYEAKRRSDTEDLLRRSKEGV